MKLGPGDPGEVQQIVDERTHLLRRFPNVREVPLAIDVEAIGTVFEERETEAIDGP